jgi:hypothetical protein
MFNAEKTGVAPPISLEDFVRLPRHRRPDAMQKKRRRGRLSGLGIVPAKSYNPQSFADGRLVEEMTGDQSRLLRVGDRVRWGATITDLGTVVGTAWSGVTIEWDDGHTSSIQHNDMARVERLPNKLV